MALYCLQGSKSLELQIVKLLQIQLKHISHAGAGIPGAAPAVFVSFLDWLNLEVRPNQGKDKALQILQRACVIKFWSSNNIE